MSTLPDAPDIARTLRTGYPDIVTSHDCSRCGNTATVYGDSYGFMCTACAIDTWDELTDSEKLSLLGFDYL